MSHEMSSLSVLTSGYVDLYYNDMHCLQVSLKMMHLHQPSKQLPLLPLPPNPLCKVYSTLYKIWSKQPLDINLQVDFNIKQFLQYFPEVKTFLVPGVFMQKINTYNDIEFVASSLPFDNTIHASLLRCDQADPRIDAILRRIYRRESAPVENWI